MRVIAGTARRLRLRTLEGKDVRPTTDRIKETLFNMITPYIDGECFIDLYAGSGQIGIEALSRGAKKAFFVDNSRKAYEVIMDNLEHTRLADRAQVIMGDAVSSLNRIHCERGCVVYLDPPYMDMAYERTFEALGKQDYIDSESVIIAEAKKQEQFDFLEDMGFVIERVKEYKTNKHVFVKRGTYG